MSKTRSEEFRAAIARVVELVELEVPLDQARIRWARPRGGEPTLRVTGTADGFLRYASALLRDASAPEKEGRRTITFDERLAGVDGTDFLVDHDIDQSIPPDRPPRPEGFWQRNAFIPGLLGCLAFVAAVISLAAYGAFRLASG